ncbi:hypothetical protein [Pseudoprimorskyibacter insulae]|uniref:DUF304 domain-containing protein n=1 Tax=Pseudoprimorskyibacter insulae TaxID=1695997 RepID=A0A2R8ANC4_9RHOB|nr:hypothetical protein [Pseudoprimorskyibacter insulae]SPF77558.1 hypothetical protein PRI8871_00141 [Pseudoprimorskyibacter insulae]
MAQFAPDRKTYLRSHLIMALAAMVVAYVALVLLGRGDEAWVGPIAAIAAIAFRGWFLMSEALAEVWSLTQTTLKGPYGKSVPLGQIAKTRSITGAVQVITHSGDKHLIKYQADPQAVIAQIEAAKRRDTQD